ncbi:MAG: heavy metal translocating P-type ATPase [Limimaricola sp.]|uniref:heavy metal translocating P-type ATPase n=1 Tax=Limimaricola sp. TaxID=2211665 RepID=UPI001D4C8498|nr:heavy metal translocating P-type ATPase [Limimaricola sp.]MBI1418919.1 heavy metal translocating P-type ATPase [Limimaricola sp.]
MSAADRLTFEIDGMTCASCVRRVERTLAAVPGVSDVSVNLANETASIAAEPGALPRAVAALNEAGYPAPPRHVTLDISEMTCASCVGRVERALAAVPGVLSAHVSLASERADLDVLGGEAAVERAIAAAEAAGYPTRRHAATAETTGDRKAAEAARQGRLTLIAAALTLPVFLAEMGGHLFPPLHHAIVGAVGQQAFWVLQFVLITTVLAWPGRQFLRKGFPGLLKGAPDMNALVALGTSAAWGYSTVATFAPGLLPPGAVAVYYEAAGVIVTLILLGKTLEARAKGRTGAAIARLVNLRPKTARVRRNGAFVEVPVAEIRAGEQVQVRPGETVAVDGTVDEGASYIDESMISGEPVPVEKAPGAAVVGGTINGTGTLVFTATAVGADTMLARIIAMVEQAQGAKLPIQSAVDRVTAWFVPAVLAAAAATVLAWLVFGPSPVLGHALVAGVSVLIIACPCAMGLATPTSIMVGTGRAAELGVLFRKGDALQALAGVRAVALDKTGTLTEGRPELARLTPAPGQDEGRALRLAAAAEAASEHPVAQALVRAAAARDIALPAATGFAARPGFGVAAEVEGQKVLVGAARLMAQEGIATDSLAAAAAEIEAQGQSPLFIAVEGQAVAVASVADRIRSTTPEAIAALHALGLKVAMITGDGHAPAEAVAARLGIDRVVSDVLPEGKVAALKALQDEFGAVAFVGDGINDAPALAAADVGLAIGTGTDIAIDSADVVLMAGDLRGVARAAAVSRATMRNIRQNLGWAFGYNVVLIPVAAGALFPAFGLMLSPALAAGAMAASSVLVVSNALRLRRAGALPGSPPDRPAPARRAAPAHRPA